MASQRSANQSLDSSTAAAHFARMADAGVARHPHLAALLKGGGAHAGRDVADAVHLLCSLHGGHPGLIHTALSHCADRAARSWLSNAADAFEAERLLVVKLTSAVGPMPSTPGAAATEAGLAAQRHALDTLARSERRGCALGAATALIGDWATIRGLLDQAASRAGLTPSQPVLPDAPSVLDVVARCSDSPAGERAIRFGGEQMLLQHRALFDLLEARASARGDW
jgi:hypothetical protein